MSKEVKKSKNNQSKKVVSKVNTKKEPELIKKEENLIEKENVIKEEATKRVKKPVNEKVIIIGLVVVILLVAFGIFGYFFYQTNMQPVATYDGGKVTKSEYTIYYKTFQPILSYYGYSSSDIPKQVANKATLDEIILKEAKNEGVKMSDDRKKEIDEQFQDKTQISQLEQQGINPDQMKQLYYSDAIISAYIDKKVDEVSDDEVLEYIKSTAQSNTTLDLNSYETSHILLKTTNDSGTALSDSDKAAKKAKAEEVLAKVKAGEDFATLASQYSEDTGTKDNGGSYTVYMDGQTDESYANAVKAMKVGDVVLVESQYGYHVIKLNSITENGRAKNKNDREDYVNKKLDSLSEEKHYKINEDNLAKAVEQIKGKSSTTSDNNTTNTTDTTSTESTPTTDTQTTTQNTTTGE